MKIITVSGAHSGVGKTTLVEQILKQLEDWSCLKVTVIKKGPCPRELPCGVCVDQKVPFTIISDSKIINQAGKDTQRMKQAGAKKVLWLKTKPEGLKTGLKQALKDLKDSSGVVIEGTSILKYLRPDLGIFIPHLYKIGPRLRYKFSHHKIFFLYWTNDAQKGAGFIDPKKKIWLLKCL